MSFDLLDTIKIPESILDAFRYVFASMDDIQFEKFLRYNVQLVIDYSLVPYKSSNINDFRTVKIIDIMSVNFHTSDDLSGLDIEISCSNFERYRFTITLRAARAVPRSMSSTIYGMFQITREPPVKAYTTVFRLCNYCLSRGIGQNIGLKYPFESEYEEYALAELSNDIQKYQREDVVKGLVDNIGADYFIDLCQKYNQMELLMVILRLTKDKDKPKLDLRL
jgi:hypothetical protein